MSALSTIVVAVDCSDTSLGALRFAGDTAREQNAHLHIVHVVPDMCLDPSMGELSGFDLQRWNERAVKAAHGAIAELSVVGLPAERVTRAVVLGTVHREIVEYAREHNANLLVIGTHGYGPIKRFLVGSVATKVLRAAPCPVVTVPPTSWARDSHQTAVAQPGFAGVEHPSAG
jgi:nucleotide-binding universal stress UspA family protein